MNISTFTLLTLLVSSNVQAASFYTVINSGEKQNRVNDVKSTMDKCSTGLTPYFNQTPEKLTVFVYGSRKEFVEGLQKELGFSKENADYFKDSSAPRPLQNKYLIPPETENHVICHEVIHLYLETNTNAKNLLNAKWFDEGTAGYLGPLVMGKEEQFAKYTNWLKEKAKDKLIDPEKMSSEKDFHQFHVNMETRRLVYLQTALMMKYFFEKYSVEDFKNVLKKMKTEPFEKAFKETTKKSVNNFF